MAYPGLRILHDATSGVMAFWKKSCLLGLAVMSCWYWGNKKEFKRAWNFNIVTLRCHFSVGLWIGIASAIFNFQSLLTVILLLICTCAYIRSLAPSLLDKNKTGLLGIFWKCARIGERKSPYVAVCCVVMAFSILFVQ